ncbi:MAG: hypothetical protein AB1458_00480 [Bacteroidota bacterium]
MARLKTGRKTLSDDQIRKHKDFRKLRANYDEAVRPLYKKPLYRDKRAFLVLLIILLLTYIISEITSREEKEMQEKNKTEQRQQP